MVLVDLLITILIALVCLGVFVAGGFLHRDSKLNKALSRTAPAALGTGDTSLVEQAGFNYRMAERAVRELERVLIHDEIVPTVSPEERRRIQSVIDDFHDKYGL
jgi:hypothetical protein